MKRFFRFEGDRITGSFKGERRFVSSCLSLAELLDAGVIGVSPLLVLVFLGVTELLVAGVLGVSPLVVACVLADSTVSPFFADFEESVVPLFFLFLFYLYYTPKDAVVVPPGQLPLLRVVRLLDVYIYTHTYVYITTFPITTT